MNANKHEIEQALAEGIEIIGGVTPMSVIKGADGRATALRVAEFEDQGRKQSSRPAPRTILLPT